MHRTRSYLRYLGCLAMVCLCLGTPAAHADVFDDFAGLLKKLEDANVSLPVKSAQVKESKAFIKCLENANNDLDTAHCIDDFEKTDVGKQSAGQTGVPSWVFDMLDAYIMFREKDYWGLVAKFGKAAVCIIAQVLTGGGVDVCGLIEELVALGKDLLDAGKAIAKFFESVGEEAWGAVKSAGCALGFGGCGKSSPPEQIAYAWIFQPKVVPEGLNAKKSVNPSAYPVLRQQLVSNALAKPAKWSKATINLKMEFTPSIVNTASKVFDAAVDNKWSEDMLKTVLPALVAKRNAYDSPNQVAALAGPAAQSGAPVQWVVDRCTNDFSKSFGFAHVDRWISQHKDLLAKAGSPKSHKQWCGSFWAKNQKAFAGHFFDYASKNLCAANGDKLQCQTLAKYEACRALLKAVGGEKQCSGNHPQVRWEIAQEIQAHFAKQGSKIPCTILTETSPMQFQCQRWPQRHACDQFYGDNFGHFPTKLVSCTIKEKADYSALIAAVAKAKPKLEKIAGYSPGAFGIDKIDPLVVHVPAKAWYALPHEKSFGFKSPSKKPGFDYEMGKKSTIDGKDTPAVVAEVEVLVVTQSPESAIQQKLDLVRPGDPDPQDRVGVTRALKPALSADRQRQADRTDIAQPRAGGFGQRARALIQQPGLERQGLDPKVSPAPGSAIGPSMAPDIAADRKQVGGRLPAVQSTPRPNPGGLSAVPHKAAPDLRDRGPELGESVPPKPTMLQQPLSAPARDHPSTAFSSRLTARSGNARSAPLTTINRTLRESLKEMLETQKYWLTKLESRNRIREQLLAYQSALAAASRELGAQRGEDAQIFPRMASSLAQTVAGVERVIAGSDAATRTKFQALARALAEDRQFFAKLPTVVAQTLRQAPSAMTAGPIATPQPVPETRARRAPTPSRRAAPDPAPPTARSKQAAKAPPATQRFAHPKQGRHRLDWCLYWGRECGAPAAAAWCRGKGFADAQSFTLAQGVGPTFVLGDRKVCTDPACDGFTEIVCAR